MDFDFLKQIQGLLGMGGGEQIPVPDFLSLEGDEFGDYGDYDADPGFGLKELGLLGKALDKFGGDIGDMEKQKKIEGSPLMGMPRGTVQLLKDYDQSRIMQMPQFEPPELIVPGLLNPMRGYF